MKLLNENQDLLDFLHDIGSFAKEKNIQIYIVGGYVRDFLYEELYKVNLHQNSTKPDNPKVNLLDLDLILEGDAIDFIKQYLALGSGKYSQENLFDRGRIRILETFEEFKTIKVEINDLDALIEFASSRTEIYPYPAAFPKVKLGASIQEDLPRRDFTINAILQSIMPNNFAEIVDKVGGINDLKNKLIRVFHDQSFVDDPTRIYRAARFMAKFDFEIEKNTLKLMKRAALHKDFSKWLKKRKVRFDIELDYIKELKPVQRDKAIHFLHSLSVISS